ncbi:MAG: carboxylating nicotinate-nucleotide diphosphorylase [Pseudomonadota bacterium]
MTPPPAALSAPALAPLPSLVVEAAVRVALAEDFGDAGDITSQACVPGDRSLCVAIVARQAGRVAGAYVAEAAFRLVDPSIRVEIETPDGDDIAAGGVIARAEGAARSLLAAERVALNFLGRMSGVATATRALVQAVNGTKARITCTRKTTPGLRAFEKYAVRCGGGVNHRFGLYDAVLIKDNHIAAAGGVGAALKAAQSRLGHTVKIEIEVDTLDQLKEALAHGPDIVMLDNMSTENLKRAVTLANGRSILEASGNVALDTVRAIAQTGVDVISSGAITHSAPCLDIGLDVM